jgi:hypothetical protein
VHRSRKRACDGKQKHKTKEEAQAHLSSLKRKRGAAIWRMNVYKRVVADPDPAASLACRMPALEGRPSAGARWTPGTAGSSHSGSAQPDVILQEHPAASPSQRCLLRLVETRPVRGDHHPAPEPQDAPQMPPPGRISRTVQGFPVGSEKVRALPFRQFPQDPLRIQRILHMFSWLGAHGAMVRPDARRMPQPQPSMTAAGCRQAAQANNIRSAEVRQGGTYPL